MQAIETRGLTKTYAGNNVVDSFDMHVACGDIYGFVGRNGAGKTTVMRMLCGLAQPSAGEVRLFERAPQELGRFTGVGVLIDSPALYPTMSARQNLMVKALSLGIADAAAECERLLGLVGLKDAGNKRVKRFSLGMRQRLGLALALVGNPDLLLLDEPMNGLDPEGALRMRELIVQLVRTRAITVVVSSHIIDQLGRMATRYGVIDAGHMVREMSAEEVRAECGDYLVLAVDDPTRAVALVNERLPHLHCTLMPDATLRIDVHPERRGSQPTGKDGGTGEATSTAVSALCAEEGLLVRELYLHERSMEEYFVELMGGADHA